MYKRQVEKRPEEEEEAESFVAGREPSVCQVAVRNESCNVNAGRLAGWDYWVRLRTGNRHGIVPGVLTLSALKLGGPRVDDRVTCLGKELFLVRGKTLS